MKKNKSGRAGAPRTPESSTGRAARPIAAVGSSTGRAVSTKPPRIVADPSAIAEKMNLTADHLTGEADRKARDEALRKWSEAMDAELGLVEESTDAAQRIERARDCLNMALEFISGRLRDLERGHVGNSAFIAERMLAPSLAFPMEYEHNVYEWDETTLDPADRKAFNFYSLETSLEENVTKAEIAGRLKEFILCGAVKAKEVSSDTYAGWRKALVAWEFEFAEFAKGNDVTAVRAFLKDVRDLARTLWVDLQIQKEIEKAAEKAKCRTVTVTSGNMLKKG